MRHLSNTVCFRLLQHRVKVWPERLNISGWIPSKRALNQPFRPKLDSVAVKHDVIALSPWWLWRRRLVVNASDPNIFEVDRHIWVWLFNLNHWNVAKWALDAEAALVIVKYHLRMALVDLGGDPVPDAFAMVEVTAVKLRYLLLLEIEILLADSAVS